MQVACTTQPRDGGNRLERTHAKPSWIGVTPAGVQTCSIAVYIRMYYNITIKKLGRDL